jgi:hypothetical protein
MAVRDTWEKAESVSRIFAAVLIPVVLGLAGLFANQSLEKTKVKDDLLKRAIEVIFLKTDRLSGDIKSFEGRRAYRSHWLEIYNSLAEVKLSDAFIAIMMEQDTIANEKELYWRGHLPSLITKTESTESPQKINNTNEDEMGHGWVAVGRLDSQRYSDVNFDVSPKVIERNGTIKQGEIIHARWSVTLRTNTRNMEDRQGYTGTDRGLLWGGECARVIASLIDGRVQTWAFIEIVQCPVANSDRGLERRANSSRPSLL